MEPAVKSATKKKTQFGLQPIGDRVVLEREASDEKTSGGILLPATARERLNRGVVLSVGEGRLSEDGARIRLQVQQGDRVIFSQWAGEEFQQGDQKLVLVREEDILAVIES